MFTQNYINFKKALFNCYSGSAVPYTVTDGTQVTPNLSYQLAYGEVGHHMKNAICGKVATTTQFYDTHFQTKCGVFFGSGSTPATKNDYTIESPITSGLTITNPAQLLLDESVEGRYSYCATFVVSNETNETINIYEIGLFTPVYAYSAYYAVLMERTVLTEPITIPPSASRLIEYRLTFNQTLNVEA